MSEKKTLQLVNVLQINWCYPVKVILGGVGPADTVWSNSAKNKDLRETLEISLDGSG
mgnify:CR=1 FL=1